MATFKHISSKNADYGAAEQYLTFEHDEFTMKPTLDEAGRLILREDYRIATLNCGEEDFAVACIADAAVRYFKQKGISKLPTYKSLQVEIEQLTAEKNALYNEYRSKKERVRELQTMKSNLSQMHHGEPSRQKKH